MEYPRIYYEELPKKIHAATAKFIENIADFSYAELAQTSQSGSYEITVTL